MSNIDPSDDKRLEILHDHYKETFARVCQIERSRDRLFLGVILLYALLILEIGYSAEFSQSLETVNVLGAEFDIRKLPLPALLDASWVLTLAITLRYCQVTTWIERHYPYVHKLEDVISPILGGGDIYRREGKAYATEYPPLLNVVWFSYVFVFPVILILASAALIYGEWSRLVYAWFHLIFDTVIALGLIALMVLYHMEPKIAGRWPKVYGRWTIWRARRAADSKRAVEEDDKE